MQRLVDALVFILVRAIVAVFMLFAITFIVYQASFSQPAAAGAPRTVQPPPGYVEWVFGSGSAPGIFGGNYGTSFISRRPVADLLGSASPASLELALSAFLLSLLIGVPLGALMAFLRRWRTDFFLRPLALLGVVMPTFWLALMLILSFAITARQFPIFGRGPVSTAVLPPLFDRLNYLALPLATLATFWIAAVALYVRQAFLAVFAGAGADRPGSRFCRLLISILQALPVLVAGLLSSLVIVETVFAWPGIGRLLLTALTARDTPVMVGIIISTSIWLITLYFLVGILCAVLALVFGEAPQEVRVVGLPFLLSVASGDSPPSREPEKSRRMVGVLWTSATVLAVLVILGVVVALFALPSLTGADAFKQDLSALLQPPNAAHPLGTDSLGRDQLARVLVGAQTTLGISFAAGLIALVIGAVLGILGAVFDRVPVVGRLLNSPIDALSAAANVIPPLFLLVPILLATGRPVDSGLLTVVFGLLGWPYIAAVVRAKARSAFGRSPKGGDAPTPEGGEGSSVTEEQRLGSNPAVSLISIVVYGLATSMAAFILMETALSFLGLGLLPPQPSLGTLFAQAQAQLVRAGYLVVVPGFLLTLILLCLAIIAARLRETFDFLWEA